MDILKVIRQDHRETKALITKILAKADGPSRELRPLARELAVMVLLHMKSEERALYEMCEVHGKNELRAFALEARIEHRLIELMLKRLNSVKPGADGQFRAAAEVVKDLLEHHMVEEEEATIFPRIQKAFTDDERAKMAKVMVNAKSKLRPRIEAMYQEGAATPLPMKQRVGARSKGAEARLH